MSPSSKMNSNSKSSQTKLPRIETTLQTTQAPGEPPLTREAVVYAHKLAHRLAYGIANGYLHKAHAVSQAQLRARKKLELEQRKKGRSGEITWIPRMDEYDDPASDRIIATFEIPGVDGKDLTLDVQDGQFVMEGKRLLKLMPRNKRYSDWALPDYEDHSSSSQMEVDNDEGGQREGGLNSRVSLAIPRCPIAELRFGKFKRAIPLPPGVGKDHVTATLSNGILQVSWPRCLDNATSAAREESPAPKMEENDHEDVD